MRATNLRHAAGFLYGRPLRSRSIRGMSLVEIDCSPSLRTPVHRHAGDLLCVILDGAYVERRGGRSIPRRPLDVFLHPAGVPHASDFRGAGTRILRVEIDPGCRPISVAEPDRERTARLARSLHAEFLRQEDAALLAVEEIALELAARARGLDGANLRSLDDADLPEFGVETDPGIARPPGLELERIDRSWPAWLLDVECCLRERYREPLTLREVALGAGVHPIHMASVFRRRHGCSVGQYVRRLRVDRAREHLARSDSPLSRIAAECGFADQCHFTRVFKRLVGTTPGRYRTDCRSRDGGV